MPPKKKGGKKKKGNKPPYMTDELWALANNIPQLVDNFRGPSPDNQVQCTISRAQAGIFLRQLIYPKKASKEKEECVGAGAVEVAMKVMRTGDMNEKAIAAGVLQSLTQIPGGLQVLTEMKPSPYAALWGAVAAEGGATSLAAAAMGVIRNVIELPEYKRFFLRYLKEADWSPLFRALDLSDALPSCGGRQAATDGAAVLESFVRPPDPATMLPIDKSYFERAQRNVLAVKNSVQRLFSLAARRDLPAAMRDSLAMVLWHVLSGGGKEEARKEMIANTPGALDSLIQVIGDPTLSLAARAAAGGAVRMFLQPDRVLAHRMGEARREALLLKAQLPYPEVYSSLRPSTSYGNPHHPLASSPLAQFTARHFLFSPGTAFGRASTAGGMGGTGGAARGLTSAGGLGMGFSDAVGVAGLGLPSKEDRARTAGTLPPSSRGLPSSRAPPSFKPVSWADYLLPLRTLAEGRVEAGEEDDRAALEEEALLGEALEDHEIREFVLRRAQLVVAAGGLPPLISLCAGPDGPLTDKEAPEAPAESKDDGKGKGKKKKGKKKKSAALLPGMAEAQTYATACLRLLSVHEPSRPLLVEHAGIRFIAPLLESKLGRVRLQARQITLYLANNPEWAKKLELYGVPTFLTGSNVPELALRPSSAPNVLYGDSHPLVIRAEQVREAAEKARAQAARHRPLVGVTKGDLASDGGGRGGHSHPTSAGAGAYGGGGGGAGALSSIGHTSSFTRAAPSQGASQAAATPASHAAPPGVEAMGSQRSGGVMGGGQSGGGSGPPSAEHSGRAAHRASAQHLSQLDPEGSTSGSQRHMGGAMVDVRM